MKWKNKVLRLVRRGEPICSGALAWVRGAPEHADDALRACPRGDWLLWLADALELPIPESAYRPAVLRALREYLPPALEELVGMPEEAAALRALPDDATLDALRDAADAVDVPAPVRIGEDDGRFSSDVGGAALWAYWAADAALGASADGGAFADEAAEAAAEVASKAANAAAGRAEHARCAEEVRAILGARILEALG